jgi:hypothetical protein
MSQILVTKKKYNFKLGYVIKVGKEYYEIIGIEWLHHPEKVNSVDATDSADQSFSENLKPSEGYAYWIEEIGIDGALGFQLKFPAVPRWTVHGNKRYIYRHRASFMNPLYFPFLVLNPDYPRFTFYNPENSAKEAVMYFTGERWLLDKLSKSELNQKRSEKGQLYYTDLTSFTDKSIGEG